MMTDRIEINPAIMLGKPVIRGTRIPVEIIIRKLSEGATTLLNLMEVQYYLHKNREKESDIKDSIAAFLPLCISFAPTDCYEAVKFRYARKEKSLSYIDCLGYILAKRLEVSFLTGDKEFEGFPNVEFVRVKA